MSTPFHDPRRNVGRANGDQLANDQASFTATLPADGDYAIEVGSTGGTADYELGVSVT